MTSMMPGLPATIAALWRYPVKSMSGERLQQADVTVAGVRGDRAYALIETATGKVVSAKSTRLYPDILRCRAEFLEEPDTRNLWPPVRIVLPTGLSVRSDAADVDQILSEHFGRAVTLARAAPDDYTVDQYYPDIEGADPGDRRDVVASHKLGEPLFAALGKPSPVPPGSLVNAFPVSLMTTSTLSTLGARASGSQFDERRFRMNVIINTEAPDFPENAWIGNFLALGETLCLDIALLVPRCVVTTLGQEGLPQDSDVLRALVQNNRLEIPGLGVHPCAGVYAVAKHEGRVHVGDSVRL